MANNATDIAIVEPVLAEERPMVTRLKDADGNLRYLQHIEREMRANGDIAWLKKQAAKTGDIIVFSLGEVLTADDATVEMAMAFAPDGKWKYRQFGNKVAEARIDHEPPAPKHEKRPAVKAMLYGPRSSE